MSTLFKTTHLVVLESIGYLVDDSYLKSPCDRFGKSKGKSDEKTQHSPVQKQKG